MLLTSVKSGFGQEFLREVYEKCEDSKELQEKSEEGFLFLTDRSNIYLLFLKSKFLCADPRCGELRSQCM